MFLDDPGGAVASPPVHEQRSRPLSERPPDSPVIGWIILGVIILTFGLAHAVDVGCAAERRCAGSIVSKQADGSQVVVRSDGEYRVVPVGTKTFRALRIGDTVEVTLRRTVYSRRLSVETVRKAAEAE